MTGRATPWVKICGVTCVEDADAVIGAGADAIGVNFVQGTRRFITADIGRAIAAHAKGRVEIVGVFANESAEALAAARESLGLDWLQLHGEETPDLVARVPRAFKALGVADADDVERAFAFPGERLLIDAKVSGHRGGTGTRFDWELLQGRPLEARVIVAGGLHPENVAELVARVSPFGVDVASGVERSTDPRRKDPEKVEAFVRNARRVP